MNITTTDEGIGAVFNVAAVYLPRMTKRIADGAGAAAARLTATPRSEEQPTTVACSQVLQTLAADLEAWDAGLGLVEAGLAVVEGRFALMRAGVERRVRQSADVVGVRVRPPARGPEPSVHMTIAAFAVHMSLSQRTIAMRLRMMHEGEHYFRDGRRVVVRVAEAERFIRETGRPTAASSIEDIAIDEVNRRRARVALAKVRRNP